MRVRLAGWQSADHFNFLISLTMAASTYCCRRRSAPSSTDAFMSRTRQAKRRCAKFNCWATLIVSILLAFLPDTLAFSIPAQHRLSSSIHVQVQQRRPNAAASIKPSYPLHSCAPSFELDGSGPGDNGGNNNGKGRGGGGGRGRGGGNGDGRNSDNNDDDDDDTAGEYDPNRPLISKIKAWLNSSEGREDILTYGISLVIAILVRKYVVEPRYIPSLSMYPTFEVGDQLAVEKISRSWFKRPLIRGDVVVFSPPKGLVDVLQNVYGGNDIKKNEAVIKRVVALEGDKVQVKSGDLYINREKQSEPYTKEDKANYKFGPITVPKDNVLVLGDNRNESLDGHIWGCLPVENVIGRAIFVYWPLWRAGRKDNV